MGWLSSEDTVQGKIVDVEVKAFRSQTTFDPKMPKVATLIQIQDKSGKNYLAFLSGEISKIKIDQKIVCTIKQTWNAYWIYRDNGNTKVMPAQFKIGLSNSVYRQINKYEIVN